MKKETITLEMTALYELIEKVVAGETQSFMVTSEEDEEKKRAFLITLKIKKYNMEEGEEGSISLVVQPALSMSHRDGIYIKNTLYPFSIDTVPSVRARRVQSERVKKRRRTKQPLIPKKQRNKKATISENDSRRCLLVEYWNTIPNVSRHIDPRSKRYQKAKKMVGQLRRGALARNAFSDTFLRRHRIPSEWLRRRWTDKAIRNGLDELGRMFQDGYWPRDKRWVPRDLGTLIYNPMSQNSWFMAVKVSPVKPLSELEEKKDPTILKMVTVLKSAILAVSPDDKKFRADETRDLVLLCYRLRDYQANLPRDRWGEIKRTFPSPVELARAYGQWIERHLPNPETRFLSIDGKTFTRFITNTEEGSGVSFQTGKQLGGS